MPELYIQTIRQIPVLVAGAYSANDAVGGLMVFASGGAGISQDKLGVYLDSVVITDRAKQDISLDLVLFNKRFTPTADNAAFDPSDSDLLNIVSVVNVVNYYDFNDSSVGVAQALTIPLVSEDPAGSFYGQLVTRGAPTYALDDLQVRITILRG